MKIGDLIKFKGSWANPLDERRMGIVMQVWTNGWSGRIQGADILWDNGDLSEQFGANNVEVVNESR
tara:strand:- start:143 stop:340 length:198 start_codon:yes stop_codon:yes gene_type:complete